MGIHLHDTSVMLLASLPMLALFIMGCYSLYLFIQIDSELEERKKAEEPVARRGPVAVLHSSAIENEERSMMEMSGIDS